MHCMEFLPLRDLSSARWQFEAEVASVNLTQTLNA